MAIPSGVEIYLRWLQLFISLAFPVVIATVSVLAWLDFRRWVENQISRSVEEERLVAEVKEFIE